MTGGAGNSFNKAGTGNPLEVRSGRCEVPLTWPGRDSGGTFPSAARADATSCLTRALRRATP